MTSLRDELLRIRSTQGTLTAPAVVEAATPDDHPLHDRFEWNDTVAGYQYRLVQARELIRSVRITYAEDKSGPKDVRAFFALHVNEQAPEREYVLVEEALNDPFQRQVLLRDLQREIASLKRKYGHLKEFAALLGEAASSAA